MAISSGAKLGLDEIVDALPHPLSRRLPGEI
jgi:hypothetical protein